MRQVASVYLICMNIKAAIYPRTRYIYNVNSQLTELASMRFIIYTLTTLLALVCAQGLASDKLKLNKLDNNINQLNDWSYHFRITVMALGVNQATRIMIQTTYKK